MTTDVEHLQGTWQVVDLETEGQRMDPAVVAGARIVVRGDRFISLGMGATVEGRVETGAGRPAAPGRAPPPLGPTPSRAPPGAGWTRGPGRPGAPAPPFSMTPSGCTVAQPVPAGSPSIRARRQRRAGSARPSSN